MVGWCRSLLSRAWLKCSISPRSSGLKCERRRSVRSSSAARTWSNRSRNSFRTGTTTSPPYQAQKRSTSSLTMCSAAGMSPRRSAAACAATAWRASMSYRKTFSSCATEGSTSRGMPRSRIHSGRPRRRATAGATREAAGRHRDRGGRRGRGAGRESRLAAHTGADEQGRLEQPMQHGARLSLGRLPCVSHLPLDLRFPEDHGIEPRRDAIQMAHRIAIALGVAVRAGVATTAQPLRQERPHDLRHGVVPLGEVEFRAIAGGEQHAAARARRQHPRERPRHFPGLVREPLAHLERRGAMIHAQNGDAHRLLTQRNRWVPGAASLSATYTSSTAVKLAMLANAARRPAQWRTTRTPTAHPKTTQVSIPHTTWAASTDAPPAYCTPNPSSTPSVTVGNPSTSDRWFNWSSRSSGGNNRNTGPKRFALSSWNCSRYRAAAMNASASMARPKTLTVMWRIDQAPRPDAGAPSGASPISNARPRSPVASGPVNTPTADARNRPSLAACSATRNRASMESVGATPTKGVSCATPITCAASPSSGTPSPSARGAGRSPANGANASAVANAYRPSAIRCGTRTTGRKAPAPLNAVAGRRSGRHLPDEPHRHAGNEFGVADIQDQPRGRVIARVHDLEHHLHLLGRRARDPGRRPEHFEHVPGRHTLRPSPIDEHDLLRTGQHVEIPLGDHHALESAIHRGRAHLARVLERLEGVVVAERDLH